jgi:hypothetical protein
MVLSDFIQQSACPVAGFKALGMPPHFAVTPPDEHHPSLAIPAKYATGGAVFPLSWHICHQTLFGHQISHLKSNNRCQTSRQLQSLFGDHACLVITQAPLIFSILVICSGSYLCWRRCGCSQSHPEKIYKLFEFAAREHASCDFVTTICTLVSFSTQKVLLSHQYVSVTFSMTGS